MEPISPVLKKMLIAATALYILGTSVFLSQLTYRVGHIEHLLDHITGAH